MKPNKTRERIRFAYAVGSVSAAALLVCYFCFRLGFNFPTAGFIELLIVVLAALRLGFWEATSASLVAVACLDYFFAPPIYSFHVEDPENWLALGAFELSALIVSHLSTQVEDQRRTSWLHKRNADRLYELSRSILMLDRSTAALAPGSFL